MKDSLPKISVLIPTLNSERVLESCLESIAEQDYPKERIEIIVADGGSTDRTVEIARKFKARVYNNPLKTGEAGKAVAFRQAQGELVALIDSDNVLPNKDWFMRMVKPFNDPEIVGSEPWEFVYRKQDSLINRYCSLLGVNDPYCYFIGNYDKRSILSGKWTALDIEQKDEGEYLKVKISKGTLPTIGANGTIWRKEVLKKALCESRYLFDTDIPYLLAEKKAFLFAKVKIGIVHLYCCKIQDFIRKQKRRVKDFFYLEGKKERKATFQRQIGGQLYFIFSVVLVLPLVIQMIKGYIKKADSAWFFHPIACWITLWVYGLTTVRSFFKAEVMSRQNWRQ